MPDKIKDLDLQFEDGQTVLRLADHLFDVTKETRTKDGQTVETGVTKRVYHYSVTAASVDAGKGAVTVKPDGSTAVTREVKVIIRDQDEAAIKEKRERTVGKIL